MSRVTVYRFTGYNVNNDQGPTARRWATKEWIERNGCAIVEGSEVMAASNMVDAVGQTIGNYDPHSQLWDEEGNPSFQRSVPPPFDPNR
jgi:hypothetical protein